MRNLFLMLCMVIGFACVAAPVERSVSHPTKIEKVSELKAGVANAIVFKFEVLRSDKEVKTPLSVPVPELIKNNLNAEILTFDYFVQKRLSIVLYRHYNSKSHNCKVSRRYISPYHTQKNC